MPFPSNVQFTPITVGGVPPDAPVTPTLPPSLDIVGSSQFPPAYFAYDGQNVYFRIRLNGDPRSKTGFLNQTWGVLFDLDNNPSQYEWMFTVNGGQSQIFLFENLNRTNDPLNDPAERQGFNRPINNFDLARASLTQDGSSFDGHSNFFLDFFVDQGTFFSQLKINASSVVRMLFFTSTLLNQVDSDSLPFSDPVTFNQANVRAQLSASQTLLNPPPLIPSGSITSLSGRINVQNTGASAASAVFVTVPFLADRIDSFAVTSATAGSANFNTSTLTLSWNIGTLANGAAAELVYTLEAVFSQPGTRQLNTFVVTGIDQFTGNTLPNISGAVTVSVQAGGSLSGIVQNNNGQPQPGVSVELAPAGGGPPIQTTVTNADGVYGLSNVPAGSYIATFSRVLFVTQSLPVTISPATGTIVNVLLQSLPAALQGTVTSAADGSPVAGALLNLSDQNGALVASTTSGAGGQYSFLNLQPNVTPSVAVSASGFQVQQASIFLDPGAVEQLDFVLQPNPGGVNGIVTGAGGQPIAGAAVTVLDTNSNLLTEVTTDAGGRYSINLLSPGTAYLVRASAAGFQTAVTGFRVSAGQISTVDFQLQPAPGSVSGIVREEITGLPLQGITVRIFDSRDLTLGTALTDANGRYSFLSLPPDSYSILFTSSSFSNRTLGAIVQANTNTVLDALLTRLSGFLTGTVRNTNGQPIGNADIAVVSNGTFIGRDTTGADGVYTIPSLLPDSYVVNAVAPGFATETLGVLIQPLLTSVLDFTLRATTGTVSGMVTTDGTNLSGALINLQTNLLGIATLLERTISDNEGVFLFPDIEPGGYIISVNLQGFQSFIRSLEVRENAVTNLSIQLQPSPGFIEGTIVDDQGNPIDATVQISVRITNPSGGTASTPSVDPSGQFLSGGLSAGPFTIAVVASGFQTDIATVSVTADTTTFVTIALKPLPGAVQGRVTDAGTGGPIGGAAVKALTQNGIALDLALTDQNGFYRLDGLRPGSYTIIAQAEGFDFQQIGAIVLADTVTQADITIAPTPGSIAGRVDPPAAFVLINLFTIRNSPISSTFSEEDGTFTFTNLRAGQYILTADAPQFSSGPVGAEVIPGQTVNSTIQLFPNPGSIAGIVTGAAGSPITNATVLVLDRNESPRGFGQTDINGRYHIGDLPQGTISIVASAPGFAAKSTAVLLGPGQMLDNIDFVLAPIPGGISGVLTDSTTGLPISGAEINVRFTESSGLTVAVVTTGPSGEFLVNDLTPAAYAITVFAAGYGTGLIGVVVTSGNVATASLAITLLTGSIDGEVQTVDGTSLTSNNTYIKLFTVGGALIQALFADSSGRFRIADLAPGIYSLSVSADGHVTDSQTVFLNAGEVKRVMFRLAFEIVTVEGIVTDAVTKLPVAGALVTVRSRTTLPIDTSFTDQFGRFIFRAISAGRRVLTVTAAGYGSSSIGIVTVAEVSNTSLNIELQPNPGTVVGFVTNLDDGSPVVSAEILLLTATQQTFATLVTDNSGSYAYGLLEPGLYFTIASAQGFATLNGTFTVTPGQETKSSFVLQPLPGSYTGRVTDAATGSPLNSISIFVRHLNNFAQIAGLASTDAEGFYLIDNLPAGNYVVNISETGFTSVQSSFIVGRGEQVVRNFELIRTRSLIIGDVSSADGSRLSDALVIAVDPNGVIIGQSPTDTLGRYAVGTGTGVPGETISIVGVAQGHQFTLVDIASPSASGFTDIHLVLQTNPSAIIGTVRNGQTGAPVSNMIITVFTEDRVLLTSAASDAEGNYVVPTLAAGKFIVTVSGQSYGSSAVRVVVPGGGGRVRLELIVTTTFGTLRGTIRDQAGNPLYEALAEVFVQSAAVPQAQPSVRSSATSGADALTFMRSIISNENGQYALSNLPAGPLAAVFSFPGKQTKSFPITIINNETTVLDVVLEDEEEE